MASSTTIKNPGPGRPFGKAVRKPIDLPDGDRLVPYYTTFSEETGVNPKYFQRNKHRFPIVTIAGIAYVRDKAGREVLATPKKARGARR